MDLRKISNGALLENTSKLAAEERKIGLEILHHFRELDRRRLFAERGYRSLFEMVVKEFGYSEAAAGRRIAAMRLLKELPVLETAIQEGMLNLSTACQLQHFLKAETKSGKVYSGSEKLELAQKLMGKSRRDCEKILVAIAPASVRRQSSHVVSEGETELKVVLKDVTLEKLKRIQDLLAHKYPHADYATLIDHMADLTLEKIDPEKKVSRAEKRADRTEKRVAAEKRTSAEKQGVVKKTDVDLQQPTTSPHSHCATTNSAGGAVFETRSGAVVFEVNANGVTTIASQPRPEWQQTLQLNSHLKRQRYIPSAIKRAVYARDGGCCTYVDPITKRKCNSRFGLEYDHILAVALGGKTEVQNLRLRCHAHNQLAAIQIFGENKVAEFVPDIR